MKISVFDWLIQTLSNTSHGIKKSGYHGISKIAGMHVFNHAMIGIPNDLTGRKQSIIQIISHLLEFIMLPSKRIGHYIHTTRKIARCDATLVTVSQMMSVPAPNVEHMQCGCVPKMSALIWQHHSLV